MIRLAMGPPRSLGVLSIATLVASLAGAPARLQAATLTASPAPRPASLYSASFVMREFARNGLRLASEGKHVFGASSRPQYLTLTPGVYKLKGGVGLRGADFTVLVFASPSQASGAMTTDVRAELRRLKEPWIQRENLVLVSRVAIFAGTKPDPAWTAATLLFRRVF
jgi:hypothetical protein